MNQEQPTPRLFRPFKRLFGPQNEANGVHAATEEARESKRIWKTLSRVQKNICIQFSVLDWQTGLEKWFIDQFLPEIHANWLDIEQLVQQGILDAQPAAVFSQRWLESNAALIAEYDAILADHFRSITHQERTVIQEISRHRGIVEENSPELRYRLRDQTFRNWIATEFAEY